MGYEHDLSDDSYFDKEFYCDICSRWFDAESDMKKHMEEHQKAQQKVMTMTSVIATFVNGSFSLKES